MSLSSSEFKDIIENGFGQRYEDNDEGESELRCFTCGKKASLEKSGWSSYKVVCEDEHEEEMVDFLIEHTRMRDGITDRVFQMNCNISHTVED